jgi:hypothetical protein
VFNVRYKGFKKEHLDEAEFSWNISKSSPLASLQNSPTVYSMSLMQTSDIEDVLVWSKSKGTYVRPQPTLTTLCILTHDTFLAQRTWYPYAPHSDDSHPALRECGYALDNMEVLQGEDDMVFDKFIRQRNQTAYHYSCGMAVKEDASGGGDVVGPQLKAFGVEGLRVADLSMFPWVLGVHLQAPVVYIAEHARRW